MAEAAVARWCGLEDMRPHLRSFLTRRCRDESECEDLVQEALLRAALNRGALQQPDRLRAWTLRIARNLLCDRARSEGRLRREEVDCEGSAPDPRTVPEPEPTFAVSGRRLGRSDLLAELARGLGDLPARDRHVLEAYYVRGLACRDVAAELAVSRDLVKVRLFRARRRLMRSVRRRVALRTTRGCVAAAG